MGKRWNEDERAELANLYHLARTALARSGPNQPSVYERYCWAAAQFADKHGISSTAAYKELCRQGAWRG